MAIMRWRTRLASARTRDASATPFDSLVSAIVLPPLPSRRERSYFKQLEMLMSAQSSRREFLEAAGVAAALGVNTRTEVALIDGVKLREKLRQQGAGPFTEA